MRVSLKKVQKLKDLSNIRNLVNNAYSFYKETEMWDRNRPCMQDRIKAVKLKLWCYATEVILAHSVGFGTYGSHSLSLIPKSDYPFLITSV